MDVGDLESRSSHHKFNHFRAELGSYTIMTQDGLTWLTTKLFDEIKSGVSDGIASGSSGGNSNSNRDGSSNRSGGSSGGGCSLSLIRYQASYEITTETKNLTSMLIGDHRQYFPSLSISNAQYRLSSRGNHKIIC